MRKTADAAGGGAWDAGRAANRGSSSKRVLLHYLLCEEPQASGRCLIASFSRDEGDEDS